MNSDLERLLWRTPTGYIGSELGPSFIPSADIARNVCYPRTHQSQIGHEPPVGVTGQFAQEQPVAMRQEPCHPAQIWPGRRNVKRFLRRSYVTTSWPGRSVQLFGWTCGDEW